MENEEYLLKLENLSRAFGSGFSLKDISFTIDVPQIVGLCGLNRSGKTALASLLGGITTGYTGRVYVDGKRVSLRSPVEAREAGIVVTGRENYLFPEMSVVDNLFFEETEKDKVFVRKKKYRQMALELFDRLDLNLNIDAPVKALSPAEHTLLSVAKAMLKNPRVLIFDDITAHMTERETAMLHGVARKLREEGCAVLIISHDLRELARLCDKVIVLKDGAMTHELPNATYEELVRAMLGTEIGAIYPEKPAPMEEVAMEIKHLSDSGKHFSDISFTVQEGEIVALAGLEGSGRDEIIRALAGLVPCQGEVTVEGETFSIHSPADAMARGIVAVTGPEDERYQQKFEKVARYISQTGKDAGGKARMIKFQDELEKFGDSLTSILWFKKPQGERKTPLQQMLERLNQAFAQNGKIYLLHLPTAPLDIMASIHFYKDMVRECKEGVSFIITSNDNEELAAIANKVVAVKDGRVSAVLTGDHITKNNIDNFIG